MATIALEDVKNYLNITWEDEETDQKIKGIMERAESVLNAYAGAKIDFSVYDGFFNQIFLDCCRYIFNNSFEDFKINFASELTTLRLYCQVKAEETDDEQSKSS